MLKKNTAFWAYFFFKYTFTLNKRFFSRNILLQLYAYAQSENRWYNYSFQIYALQRFGNPEYELQVYHLEIGIKASIYTTSSHFNLQTNYIHSSI